MTQVTQRKASNSVPQGLILVPILFSILVNDLDVETECTLSRFAREQNQDWRLIHHVVVLPFRGTRTGWRMGLRGVSSRSAKGNVQSCIWGGVSTGTSRCWGAGQLQSSSAEK